ncbi:nuclear transport factor 2 family protein [Paraburkholderia silviterrae]|uniref:Nuclear transport factor 2 family protein n=1 Tax=Paraburkholderia silviterrae TaxID=2528715 RepID=A0A4R5M554_9BURK|nr:nuclear transport factor 2 family protein [Paraburkholderia silviterrae]TDG20925.1 nuclear transport factor 2 family protein [Paraburkholderia silviterrae]
MEAKLQQLLDEAEIRRVHLRYCRGIDRMDWDLVRSCYHPDAIDRHGAYNGGVEGFIDWAAELLPSFESTQHFTGNQYVEVHGDAAFAEHYAQALHRTKPAGDKPAMDWLVNIRYVDRMERRNGEWRIADRVVVLDSQRSDPVPHDLAPLENFTLGRRDKQDPSYLYRIA